jgi:DNA-binding transcriptional LysR family regulator
MPDALEDLRLADVLTFFAVRRAGSVTSAAREMHVTPSQVSKSIARLERQLSITLLSRGKQRVTVSESGLRVLPVLEDLVIRLRQIARGELEHRILTVGAPSYLQSFALPLITKARPELRVRGCELPPALVRAYAAEALFDVTLSLGARSLPRSFVISSVGTVKKALFGPPSVAKKLGKIALPEKVKEIPFIAPVYVSNGQFLPADDDCPLLLSERHIGHEVSTIGLALELAVKTEQLVFGPTIAVRSFVERGELVEIPVRGWDVKDELLVGCSGDRVRAAEQKAICESLREGLLSGGL